MLRITPTSGDAELVLRLEGRLVEPWPAELLNAWREAGAGGQRIVLDLSGVTFVDAAGANCLRDLMARGAAIRGCSGFIAELLKV
jgi:anti-anti-sigma regulatory factor